jgi:tetratricopeptide (TPR) repeat protein
MTSTPLRLRFVRRVLATSAFSVLVLSVSLGFAQHGGGGGARPQSPPPQAPTAPQSATDFDQNKLFLDSNSKPADNKVVKGASCFLPPLNGVTVTTVKVEDLQIPSKAQKSFENGCAALRSKKTTDAENHLRKAVKEWPKYSSAWVVLGQVLEAEQKSEEARDACSQPLTADSGYVPAYLCLADISARSESWDKVLQFSNRALEIDPTTDPVAYDYHAAANFNLHHLAEAEKSALRAVEIDQRNADPRVHFLLAQIYEAKGDRASEANQLREYLKYASDPSDAAMVKSYLAELDKQSK